MHFHVKYGGENDENDNKLDLRIRYRVDRAVYKYWYIFISTEKKNSI